MKPAPFRYVRAERVVDALESLREPDAKVIAGGQSLLPVMNLRMGGAPTLVDIDGLRELDAVVVRDDELVLGALVRHQHLVEASTVRRHAGLLAAAASHIGHVAIRNRGTIGGSLAHADPSAELPAAALALDARVVAERAGAGIRELGVGELLDGVYATTLEEDELLTWVRVPRSLAEAPFGFHEVATREGDFAEAGACAVRTSTVVRVTVFAVEATPRLFEVQADRWSDDLARRWADELQPLTDDEHRRDLATAAIRRAVAQTGRDRRG